MDVLPDGAFMISKATAYIIRQKGSRRELLVFTHFEDADVPLQVPAGTVEDGEEIECAARREIVEESGLDNFRFLRKLGRRQTFRADLDDFEDRHFFLYEAVSDTPESWLHHVNSDGEDAGMIFSYRWADTSVIGEIVPILAAFLTKEHLPELFIECGVVDSSDGWP